MCATRNAQAIASIYELMPGPSKYIKINMDMTFSHKKIQKGKCIKENSLSFLE